MQCYPMIQTRLIVESAYCVLLAVLVNFIWIRYTFKFQTKTESIVLLYIFMRFSKTRAGRVLTLLENVLLCTFMNPGASPSLDFSEVKGSKSLFRWVDLLRPIMPLHCDRLEAERQSGQNKDKGGIKEENRTQLQHLYNLPYLTPEH